jgi:hypothetical protein
MDCTPANRGVSLDETPRYLIRDRDRIYGAVVTRRLRAMGIRNKPTALASTWQNGYAERLIGSARMCGPRHLSWARCICAEFSDRMPAITTTSERIGRWIKTRRSLVRSHGWEALNCTPSLAAPSSLRWGSLFWYTQQVTVHSGDMGYTIAFCGGEQNALEGVMDERLKFIARLRDGEKLAALCRA